MRPKFAPVAVLIPRPKRRQVQYLGRGDHWDKTPGGPNHRPPVGVSASDAALLLAHLLDQPGVGYLMRMGVAKGRATRKDLEIGICGEHGGDPRSVAFCHEIGLDYVSCSPYRVPIAKLAAAHAALKETVKVKEMGEK